MVTVAEAVVDTDHVLVLGTVAAAASPGTVASQSVANRLAALERLLGLNVNEGLSVVVRLTALEESLGTVKGGTVLARLSVLEAEMGSASTSSEKLGVLRM